MYETQDFVVPIIWEGDGAHPSPMYSERGAIYGIGGIPHAQFQGVNDVVGGGTNMLPSYTSQYNNFVNIDSPFEIDLSLNVIGADLELTADVEVTGTVTAADLNKLLFMVTYDYGPGYTCSVQRYEEFDFALTTIGETETFVTTFAVAPEWDLANVRGIAMIQKMDGTVGNYPIHQAAIAGYPLGAPDPIADTTLEFDEVATFDLTNYFHFQGAPINIDLTVESSDETIATVEMAGDILIVTAQTTVGTAQISISGEYEGYGATDVFEVDVYDPASVMIIFHLFDSYGDGWSYSGAVNFIQLGEHYITLESGAEGEYVLFLYPGDYDYTYTAADTYGSENSWTINLEDGTELGSGQGGVNGTYEYSFTVPGVVPGTIEGLVTLDGVGDITAVEVYAGGYTTNPDVDGNYVLQITPGTYDVTASLEGYDIGTIEDVVVIEGTATTGINFDLLTDGDDIIVLATTLANNYPNPFNPTTNIAYSVLNNGLVRIDVYNTKGQLINTLINEDHTTGNYVVNWNGTDESSKPVSSGVYFYKMKSGSFSATKKMILLK